MYIYCYHRASKSARALANALGWKRLHRDNRAANPDALVVNWGSRSCPYWNVVNQNASVIICSNKLTFFRTASHHLNHGHFYLPKWCETQEEAVDMLQHGPVVCRTELSGHSGRGIVIADNADELIEAPLYTQYIRKSEEFRVHVFGGEVIHIQRKARIRSVPDDQVNWRVRNHQNGFIYQINYEGFSEAFLDRMKLVSKAALSDTGAHFGAVDVIWHRTNDWLYVLEINTAPGLEGATGLSAYVNAISNL